MAGPSNPLEFFRNFPNINEAWELVKTGLVVIEEKLYRLELWHSYSNPDIPYYVSICIQQDGVWRRMPDPPFPVGLSGDEALGAAMAFLSENPAA
jgi:hypothetical protein